MNAPLSCDRCPRLCASRRDVVNGHGPKDARILVVSSHPSAQDERHGIALYHKAWAGKKLRRNLFPLAHIDPDTVRFENIVRCAPPNAKGGKPGAPSAKEIDNCREYLAATIAEADPAHIITLGAAALKWFLPGEKLSAVHGRTFVVDGRLVTPMYHPDSAKPGLNPKLALVMDEDWSRFGENTYALQDSDGPGADSSAPGNGPNRVLNFRDDAPGEKYSLISGHDLAALMQEAQVTRFAFDYESDEESNRWNGTFQAHRAIIIGYSVAWEEGVAYYCTDSTEHIRPWLEDPAVEVVAHNAKYEWILAKGIGVTITNLHDTKLMAYLLRKIDTGLKALSWSELEVTQTRFEDVDWNDLDAVVKYGAADSDMTLRLFNRMWPELVEADLLHLYTNIEIPLIPVLATMEMAGVLIDPAPLHKLEGELHERMGVIDKEIAALYPHPINWRSVPQKQNALFGKVDGGRWNHEDSTRRLTYKEWSKHERQSEETITVPLTKLVSYTYPGLGITTKYGTDTDIPTLHRIELAGNAHPIVPLLIERSTISRALSGEIVKLPKLRQEDGRVHASFHQSGGWEELGGDTKEGTDTGRLSCSGPNLNNITNHGDTSRPYVAE